MNRKIKTSLDLLVEIFQLEKDECAAEYSRINAEYLELNETIRTIKETIFSLEAKLRESSQNRGVVLDLGSYELIRNNLDTLHNSLKVQQLKEKKLRLSLNSAIDALKAKIRAFDVVTDKQSEEVNAYINELRKKADKELDDLCAQRLWTEEYV